jgi:Zn-finger nucleic acid-binding protein
MDSIKRDIPLSLTSHSFTSVGSQQQQQQQQSQQQDDVNDSVSSNSHNNNDDNSSSKTSPVNKDDSKMVLDQMCCAICLDILVNPQTIVPCGHTYCGSCLTEIDNCPECRGSITSRVPALQLNGLIESLVQQQVPNMFNPSDLEHYQERKKTDQSQRYQVQYIVHCFVWNRNV